MNEGRTLTFSQREGYAPLPVPLELKELPTAARTAIWNALYTCMEEFGRRRDNPWPTILQDLFAFYDGLLDEWNYRDTWAWMRKRLASDPFNDVFDVIEFLMRHRRCPSEFISDLASVFRRFQLAYIIDAGPPPTILPATTVEEGNELARNLAELQDAGLDGCTTHLRNASKCINDGDSAGSVRESICAVESVARQIDPKASKGLGAALASLEHEGALHPAFKQAISKLYGYTSDEQGIRHALLDKAEANVTQDEALFMLGACASFASYLWRKHKAATGP